MKENGKFHIVS